MLSDLTGFTLARAIPDSALMGVMTGAHQVCGGVIRNGSGQIVAHLVNASNPVNHLTSLFPPIDMVIGGINTVQLSRIGTNVSQLLSLAKGTMALSGLTLSVCAAGFLFLNNKVKRIDEKLLALSKDVKEIRIFLELQERARIITALKNLREIVPDSRKMRESFLVNTKQTLGEIHEKYRELLLNSSSLHEAIPAEEYYTITALGNALCAAEMDLPDHAVTDLKESYEVWSKSAENISKDLILKNNPERFLTSKYAQTIKTDELIDWMDFANKTSKGIGWIDELRTSVSWRPHLRNSLSEEERFQIELMRKIVARDRVFRGYISQYEYYAKIKQRPSRVQNFIESLPKEQSVDDCFIFVSEGYRQPA